MQVPAPTTAHLPAHYVGASVHVPSFSSLPHGITDSCVSLNLNPITQCPNVYSESAKRTFAAHTVALCRKKETNEVMVSSCKHCSVHELTTIDLG